MVRVRGSLGVVGLLLAVVTVLHCPTALSEDLPKARLSPPHEVSGAGTAERIRLAPVLLDGGSELSIVAPKGWLQIAQEVSSTLKDSHSDLSNLFGDIPQFRTSVQLMDEDTFFVATGAPKWTNALFYKGQIILPLPADLKVDLQNITRSIRHEYTHAVIHALSGGNCPGWLDEGLAQWEEGPVHPAIKRALSTWLVKNDPLPLGLLQGGFTRLEQKMVPAAYAQSLWMSRYLLDEYGFIRIRNYFNDLRYGTDREKSFRVSFGITQSRFEQKAARAMAANRAF